MVFIYYNKINFFQELKKKIWPQIHILLITKIVVDATAAYTAAEEEKAAAEAAKKTNVIKTCMKNLERCHKVRIYSNKQLAKISRVY